MVYNEITKILFTNEQIQKKVAQIGAQITNDYRGQKPLMVCTLKGAVTFFLQILCDKLTQT